MLGPNNELNRYWSLHSDIGPVTLWLERYTADRKVNVSSPAYHREKCHHPVLTKFISSMETKHPPALPLRSHMTMEHVRHKKDFKLTVKWWKGSPNSIANSLARVYNLNSFEEFSSLSFFPSLTIEFQLSLLAKVIFETRHSWSTFFTRSSSRSTIYGFVTSFLTSWEIVYWISGYFFTQITRHYLAREAGQRNLGRTEKDLPRTWPKYLLGLEFFQLINSVIGPSRFSRTKGSWKGKLFF